MPAAQATHVRREVRSLAAGDQTLAFYGEAIARMREREASDPTSWSYQAAIHGTHAAQSLSKWNSCEHQTWYFAPWHRMYLYYFERIVRAAVIELGGPESWALPYWNYDLGADNAELPPAFRDEMVNGQKNPLYVAERAPGINHGARLPWQVTSPKDALASRSFTGITEFGGGVTAFAQQKAGQTGNLEQTPHNDVHGQLGGEFGWMNDQKRAAQDPIFWLHHTNIDRLWVEWIAEIGKHHSNPADSKWTGQAFGFFDADGSPVSKTCAEVLDTIADLDYEYDTQPARPTAPAPAAPAAPAAAPPPPAAPPPAPATAAEVAMAPPPPAGRPRLDREAMLADQPTPEIVGASESSVRLVGEEAGVTVAIDPRARRAALAELGGETPGRVVLKVEDIEADASPGSVYGVYVNLPDHASAEQQTAHYAGNVSFFGVERERNPRGDEHAHGLRIAMDITGLVDDLRRRGEWDEAQLHVSFRPLRLIPPKDAAVAEVMRKQAEQEDPPVHIGRVSVFYG